MNKMISPKQSMIISILFLILAFPVAMYADSTKSIPLYAATVILVAISVGVRLIFGRCPKCGSLLKSPWTGFCVHCGHTWED